ncbi:putative ABC transport system permease protein [Pedobacter cryoconitis]|uniref:Putative ABC transport system permease protein n=1 Tax=Pedobacter cryoconitis TaxID=188932 RepID=A0A7W9E2D8_9SPHI|nr:FtsX-like permease family protein [Pedobacter cryoconitis]MBB5638650.1 putative ABC transport system permease protein [Pedobacter cryoconitis]
MLKHLFILIWNKRKQNFLFLSELLVSFLVIFAVFSFLVYYFQNYKKPLGFEYEKVWSIHFTNSVKIKNMDSLSMYYDNLRKTLKSLPQIEKVSFSGANIPYSNNNSTTGLTNNGKKYNRINNYRVENEYKDLWKMKLVEGRWYNEQDITSTYIPMVINESLKEEMFGKGPATGKLIGSLEDKIKWKVIGVTADMKANGDFYPAGPAIYAKVDTSAYRWMRNALIKVSPGADAAFESRLYKLLSGTLKNSNIEITHLTDMRKSKNEATIIPMIIFMIIAGFLMINVALGLFGVLWYNINKRRSEIGLRRAIGAGGKSVSYQLVYESLILATMSLTAGCFFAIQFPLLNVFDIPASVYLTAILLAMIFIYMLVFLCSLYPGKQAAAIHPAIALHEE